MSLNDEVTNGVRLVKEFLATHGVQPTTPKPRCDAQGRLLEELTDGDTYYYIAGSGVDNDTWQEHSVDENRLKQGNAFISQPAAEAELTRLKCLQRLRGMEGYKPHGGGHTVIVGETYRILDGFDEAPQRFAAQKSITPEERAAFLYREPMGEK
jgi:hypothetical protein